MKKVLLACIGWIIVSTAGISFGAIFEVADRAGFKDALKIAASNGEDDIIKVAAGLDLGSIQVPREPGHSLSIEGGYNAQFKSRFMKSSPSQSVGTDSVSSEVEDVPQQSTTGPTPLPDMKETPLAVEGGSIAATGGTMRVLGVPGYLWRHGCGPTAVGMVVGYLDERGYRDLFDGDASSQGEAINQGIASQGQAGSPGHYEDYSLPIDYSPDLYQDKSELPVGDEHSNNSIADFMQTSWSSRSNRYGWSWSSDIIPSFNNYIALRHPGYHTTAVGYSMPNSLTWAVLTNSIDNNRPMVFLVDTNADGLTDHFVTVVGYSDSPTRQYACLDTWAPTEQVRWCNFATIASGTAWGIWGGWSLDIVEPAPGDVDHNGDIDLKDVLVSLKVSSGMAPGSVLDIGADVNGDHQIGLSEALYSLQWTAGLINK